MASPELLESINDRIRKIAEHCRAAQLLRDELVEEGERLISLGRATKKAAMTQSPSSITSEDLDAEKAIDR